MGILKIGSYHYIKIALASKDCNQRYILIDNYWFFPVVHEPKMSYNMGIVIIVLKLGRHLIQSLFCTRAPEKCIGASKQVRS